MLAKASLVGYDGRLCTVLSPLPVLMSGGVTTTSSCSKPGVLRLATEQVRAHTHTTHLLVLRAELSTWRS